MLDKIKTINIGKGIGELKFGASREQVLALLGEPAEREKYSLSELENDDTEAWHYDDLDLSLSFDEESDWRLSSIAISSPEYTLQGQPLIGKTKTEVLNEFRAQDWGDPVEDDEVSRDNPENSLLHLDRASMSLWFENEELTEVQIGPFYESEEDLN